MHGVALIGRADRVPDPRQRQPATMSGLSSRRKLLITLAAPWLGLAGIELGLRLYGFEFESPEVPVVMWNPGRDEAMRTGEDMHVPDAGCLWALRPGAEVPYDESGEVINPDGYRGPRLRPKRQGSLRVALLGESTIFGMGMCYAETSAARVDELLGDSGDAFTAGVIGYTVHQGRARYHALVRDLDPDVVVIAFGLVNEANPAQVATDRDRIEDARWRASRLGRFLAWARVHTRTGQLADYWRIERAGGAEAVAAGERAARERRKELRSTYGEADWPGLRRSPPDQYAECLTRLVREVLADGARPIVVQLPSHPGGCKQRPILERYREANRAVARAEGVQFLDMPSIVAGNRPTGVPRVLSMLQEGDYWHLNELGHRRFARAIEQHVLDPHAGLATRP